MATYDETQRPDGLLRYRVERLEKALEDLDQEMNKGFGGVNERLDRLTIWLLGGILTICVFALGIAATLLSTGGS